MKKKVHLALLLLISVSVIGGIFALYIKKNEGGNNSIKSESAIAVNCENFEVIYEKDSRTTRSIASLTKILLVYVVLDQIENQKLSWEDTFHLSTYAEEIGSNPNLSNVPMYSEQEYTVRELMEGVLIASANNCAVTLAEGISGSEEKFIELIKQYLEEWEITMYQLINVTGLDSEDLPTVKHQVAPYNTFSAYDLAKISSKLINKFPSVLEITKQEGFQFSGIYIENSNKLLKQYNGVDGLKTGTTASAGSCLISTCEQKGKRVITVVLGAESDQIRYKDTAKLLNYSFRKI